MIPTTVPRVLAPRRYDPGSSPELDQIIVGCSSATTSSTLPRSAGFIPALRAKVFDRFHKLEIKICPFSNLP
jgi:hypothetical protein